MEREVPSLEMKMAALYDYWAFIQMIGFQGGTSQFSDIHWEFANFLTNPQQLNSQDAFGKQTRRLAEMPRGYLKSTLTVGYILWRIYRNPVIRILFGANIKDLSQKFLRELRQWLEDKWCMQYIWNDRPHIDGILIPDMDKSNRRWSNNLAIDTDDPNLSDERKVIWNNTAIQVVRPPGYRFGEPTVFATSVETRQTGHHYDLIVLDDIVDFVNSSTVAGINRVKTWADDIESIVNKKPRYVEFPAIYEGLEPFGEFIGDEVIVMGTHYDPNDYYTYLENNVEDFRLNLFIRNIYKNSVDNSDGYNWPEYMNPEMELYMRKRLRDTFYPQYLNITVSEVRKIFNYDNIQWLPKSRYEIKKHGLWGYAEISNGDGPPTEVKLFIVIDPAASMKDGACDTAIIVGGVDREDRLYAFEVFQDKLKPSGTCRKLLELARKWGTHVFTLETVGYQLSLKWVIEEYFKERTIKVVVREYLPTGDKMMRIETYLEPHFTDGMIVLEEHLRENGTLTAAIKFFGSTVNVDTLDGLAILREVSRPGRRPKADRPESNVYALPINKRFGGIY